MEALKQDTQLLWECGSPVTLCPSSWVVAAALAAPHFLYAFIWFKPRVWMHLFGRSAVDIFALCGALGKFVQFVAVSLWIACNRQDGLCVNLSAIGLVQWLLTLVLFGYGQSLNAGIFKAIGHVGVYYGFKLGHTVPWCKGWPFDTVSHPQYVGSVLSVWALVALLWGQVSTGGLLVLGGYWTALYVVTGVHEEFH